MVNTYVDDIANERLLFIDRPTPIDQLEIDTELRDRASILMGSVAVGANIEIEPTVNEQLTLAEACKRAAGGDPEALQMVRMNVQTDYFERAYKSGHISRVRLTQDGDGLSQYGQRLVDTHMNSITYLQSPILRERARVEALNGVRNEYLAQQGVLKDNLSVTFSLVTRKVSEKQASDLGFFTDTWSLAAQIMTDDDGIVIDTAFIAGRDSGAERASDEQAVCHFLAGLGLDFSNYDADQMLEHPVIIPKSLIRDRVVFLERFEKSIEAVRGYKTFFGRATNEHHTHASHVKLCEEREREMKIHTESTVQALLAASDSFMHPLSATDLLSKLNDELLKRRIIDDRTIDSNVLGVHVAYYVNHARHLAEQGIHNAQMAILLNKINKEGRSSSCPGGGSQNTKDNLNAQPWDVFSLDVIDQKNESAEEKLEDCDFISKECPKCHQKEVKTTVKNGKYYGACGCVG